MMMSKYGYSAISLVNVLYSDNNGNCFMPSRETQIISLCLYDRKWRNDSRKAIRLMRIDKAISFMMTSSKGNIFRVTGPLCREFTGPRHKGQWRGALMFSLICARINSWVNNGEAGDLRRYRAHYGVIVMLKNIALSCLYLSGILFEVVSVNSIKGC